MKIKLGCIYAGCLIEGDVIYHKGWYKSVLKVDLHGDNRVRLTTVYSYEHLKVNSYIDCEDAELLWLDNARSAYDERPTCSQHDNRTCKLNPGMRQDNERHVRIEDQEDSESPWYSD